MHILTNFLREMVYSIIVQKLISHSSGVPNSNLNTVTKLIGITLKIYIETIHMDNTYRLYKLI